MTFMKNFTLIVKPTKIRVVILCCHKKMIYSQLYVKNALLNGLLKEIVFIE